VEVTKPSTGVICFGAFEVQLGTGELRKRGLKIKPQASVTRTSVLGVRGFEHRPGEMPQASEQRGMRATRSLLA
jgi:hypothetical protein